MISKNPAIRWASYFAIGIVFALLCAWLSHWQFGRNDEVAGQIALVEKNYDAEPVPFSTLVSGTTQFDPESEWKQVQLRGQYISADQLLARNRPRGGTSAFEVLVPLKLDDGRIVIVNRGWVPPGEGPLPDVIPAAPSGEVTVIARLRPSENLPSSGRGAPEGQVPTINVPSIAKITGANTVTSLYALMVSENPSPAEVPNKIDKPKEDPGPHLSYAIQWILFALMGFIFIGYIIKTERNQRREDAGLAPKRAKRKRRDQDADAEDALIDA